MTTARASINALFTVALVLYLVITGNTAVSLDVGDSQCADSTAKSVLTTLGGRSRIMTVLMNYIKCLQKSSPDLYKMISELLSELANCMVKNDSLEILKCFAADSGLRKVSAVVVKAMDVVKCALE